MRVCAFPYVSSVLSSLSRTVRHSRAGKNRPETAASQRRRVCLCRQKREGLALTLARACFLFNSVTGSLRARETALGQILPGRLRIMKCTSVSHGIFTLTRLSDTLCLRSSFLLSDGTFLTGKRGFLDLSRCTLPIGMACPRMFISNCLFFFFLTSRFVLVCDKCTACVFQKEPFFNTQRTKCGVC